MIATMTADEWYKVLTPIIIAIAAAIQAWSASKNKAAVQVVQAKVDDTATKVDSVVGGAKARDVKLDALSVVTSDVHKLVNSNMGAQLKISAIFARRISDLTSKPQDATIAAEAERLLADHIAKQAIVDENKPKPVEVTPTPCQTS